MATSFSGGGSRSTRREPPTIGKQLETLSLAAVSRVYPFCNLQSRAASSTTKTGRHDIAEILLKMAVKHQKSNQSNQK
jgi:hypothetical protein